MKKRLNLIAGGLLGLLMVSPQIAPDAMAQDDAYLTPSRAKTLQAKEKAEREARIKILEERKAAEEAKRQRARVEYENDVNDWYNRRDMELTEDEMEENLDRLDGVDRQPSLSGKGGKYSQRLRRFSGDNANVIVLHNVDRIYVVDDYDYDPWSNSYYGRDWDNGVNITINYGSPWSWGYPYYGRWMYPYDYRFYSPWVAWSYPWYDGWYRPWYSDPWYYGPNYYSWGYRPWRPYHYGGYYGGYWSGYHNSYWNGYHDGRVDRYYNTPKSSAGRSSGRYYNRSSHNAIYGRALGNSNRTNQNYGTYNRATRTFTGQGNNDNNRRYNTGSTNRTSRWDRNANTQNRNRTFDNRSTTPTRSSGSYSAPSRNNSGGGTTRTNTGRQTGGRR